jgi:hypothetical protein
MSYEAHQNSSEVVYCSMEIKLQLNRGTKLPRQSKLLSVSYHREHTKKNLPGTVISKYDYLTYSCFYDGLFIPSRNNCTQLLHFKFIPLTN